jgi:hypothetical protein
MMDRLRITEEKVVELETDKEFLTRECQELREKLKGAMVCHTCYIPFSYTSIYIIFRREKKNWNHIFQRQLWSRCETARH